MAPERALAVRTISGIVAPLTIMDDAQEIVEVAIVVLDGSGG